MTNKNHLVIFDMNGVLFSKNERLNNNFSETPLPVQNFSLNCIHPNIDLEMLGHFYSTHSFYLGLWTTGMYKNAKKPHEILTKLMGVNFDCFLTQEQCSIGKMGGSIKTIHCVKDLRKPSQMLGVDIMNCMLVDDSEGKRYGDQNLFLFNSAERDILRAIKEIDRFICCTDKKCMAKKL